MLEIQMIKSEKYLKTGSYVAISIIQTPATTISNEIHHKTIKFITVKPFSLTRQLHSSSTRKVGQPNYTNSQIKNLTTFKVILVMEKLVPILAHVYDVNKTCSAQKPPSQLNFTFFFPQQQPN